VNIPGCYTLKHRKPEGKNYLEDPVADGGIILRRMLRK
jgi:hypothetical protein